MENAAYTQDGKWSWFVCLSATLSWFAAMGFVFSFGIFFPVFMDYFQESREKTGKHAIFLLLNLSLFLLVAEESTMKFNNKEFSLPHISFTFNIMQSRGLTFIIFWIVSIATLIFNYVIIIIIA